MATGGAGDSRGGVIPGLPLTVGLEEPVPFLTGLGARQERTESRPVLSPKRSSLTPMRSSRER